MVPTKIFFTKGVGRHKERLHSFELALRDAGIQCFNLVAVSSIFPPKCKIVSPALGLPELKPGQIIHCVIARNEDNEPNRLMAASIGLAIPADENSYGYLSEHHSFGENEDKVSDYSEDLAASMLASTLGIPFDVNTAWDERKETYMASGKIIRTRSITQTAVGDKDGLWTCVIAVAVFVP